MSRFHKFYGLLNALPYDGDRQELKESLVNGVSLGRTVHLRELSDTEYEVLCMKLNHVVKVELTEGRQRMKRKRRAVLLLMKEYGLDTRHWTVIDGFCLQPCIAGKRFKDLTADELDNLNRKMHSILNKQH